MFWKKSNYEAPPNKPKIQNLFTPSPNINLINFRKSDCIDELDDDDASYLLNTLYYTDAISNDEPSPYLDAMKRQNWLFEAYSDFFTTRGCLGRNKT